MTRHVLADFSVNVLEAAINYWRAQSPATGKEGSLSREVNVLAGLYARAIYMRQTELRLEHLSSDEIDLIEHFLNIK
jgi:hypothetical protein